MTVSKKTGSRFLGKDICKNRIIYTRLNARQKENYNYVQISALLANYGFVTMRLSDDWQNADFIAQHIDGEMFLKVQLKSRLAFRKKYCDKGLYIAFFSKDGRDDTRRHWYLYPHDEVLQKVLEMTGISRTHSWRVRGGYSFPKMSKQLCEILEPYQIR